MVTVVDLVVCFGLSFSFLIDFLVCFYFCVCKKLGQGNFTF